MLSDAHHLGSGWCDTSCSGELHGHSDSEDGIERDAGISWYDILHDYMLFKRLEETPEAIYSHHPQPS